MVDYQKLKFLFQSVLNITQAEIGEKIGYNRVQVGRILSGKNKNGVPEDFVTELLKAYPQINKEWLIDNVGEPLINNDDTNIIKIVQICFQARTKKNMSAW